jgi:hypothetical protein
MLVVDELVANAIVHGKGQNGVEPMPLGKEDYALSVCNDRSPLPEGFYPAARDGLRMRLGSSPNHSKPELR